MIEWFSIKWLQTKPRVITLANHKGHRQNSGPIKALRNYLQLTQSARKCVRLNHNWIWFYF